MTDEAPKITSAIKTPREKNPGRVAAGKRLVAISKEAKERKKLERENTFREPYDPSASILVGGLVVVAGLALYFLTRTEGTEGTEALKNRRTEETKGTEGTEGTKGTKSSRPETLRPERSFQAYSMDD